MGHITISTSFDWRPLTPRDISIATWTYMRVRYPQCFFSVMYQRDTVSIALLASDFYPWRSLPGEAFRSGYHHIDEDSLDTDMTISEEAREVFQDICAFVLSLCGDQKRTRPDWATESFCLSISIGEEGKRYEPRYS